MKFSELSQSAARVAGKPLSFWLAVSTVVVWAVTGPVFRFSDTWQLVINTGTTIVNFLMCFLIQATQNRDGGAIQAKLDELIRVTAARDDFIGIDRLPADEIETLRKADS